MENNGNACLRVLKTLEAEGEIATKFSTMGTSSWVSIKNIVFEKSLSSLAFKRHDYSAMRSWKLPVLILLSMWNYFKACISYTSKPLFIGAGSGLLEQNGVVVDSYLPNDISLAEGVPQSRLIYFLSADHLAKFWSARSYLKEHDAVLYSFVISPLRFVLGRFLFIFIKNNPGIIAAAKVLSSELEKVAVKCSVNEVIMLHAKFAAGVILYRMIFAPLRISEAFVVSAYSNSESCAALKMKKVLVTEIQHGVIGSVHRGYNYACRHGDIPVPDYVSVYDEFWRTELLDAGFFKPEQIRIGGRVKYQLAEKETVSFSKPYIIFTGQGILKKEVCDFIREYGERGGNARLFYIPHPTESEVYLAGVNDAANQFDNIEILAKKNCSTEALIMNAVAHVSIYSSCHFDAVHYLGKTYIFDAFPDNVMHYYSSRVPDKFVLIGGATDLIDQIGHCDVNKSIHS
ncbi:hypothetical protein [Chromobacterium violaceum]|uniref:hypothetical protein n=1 Tax=Chromobacterium violaceum TaxID=536 RepID=UPI001125044D|nr:hypothetical protein [Chromobacterium violaceum]